MKDLDKFKETVARACFGLTPSEARAKGICISCKEPVPKDMADIDIREYNISGLCPKCWDSITGE